MTNQESIKKLIHCYNKGCGKMFDPNENFSNSCQFHPGNPIFHDAIKGWSCCDKKSTDFSTFLSIPGCKLSYHSNSKPLELEKSLTINQTLYDMSDCSKKNSSNESFKYETTKEKTRRPTQDEPLVELKRVVASNLEKELLKINEMQNETKSDDIFTKTIPIGTPCKNATCQKSYQSEQSNLEKCIHHPGVAIFHEGMKYWSCCQRKTSEFENFINQSGCSEGYHLWLKKKVEEIPKCRYDFHQTGGFAIVTIYSKNSIPDKSSIKANQIKLEIKISYFENDTIKTFEKPFNLFGVIKLEECVVHFYQTKVEIKLKKADISTWKELEFK